MSGVDISNLRFYAEMAREFKWETDVIHFNVIETTLNEIADRFEAENQRLKAEVEEEKERADANFVSLERIKASLSDTANKLKAANLAHEQYREWAAGQIESLQAQLRNHRCYQE